MTTSKDWITRIERRWGELNRAWRSQADRVVRLYEAHDPAKHPFNILYSNTEVILPALYNSTPRPEVSPRYAGPDRALDTAVARTVERACEYFADSDHGEYETYNEAIEAAVIGMLVPGLGLARARYKEDGGYQTICFESVAYDRFVWPPARTWRHVTWVAFGHDLSQVDFERQFPEFIKTSKYKEFNWDSLESEEPSSQSEEPQPKGRSVLVWEVWDWSTRRVLFVCSRWPEEALLEEPYPQRLTSRFPCPQPLTFARKVRELVPVVPYRLYEQQAEELNHISRRIKRIVNAIRARGIYNSIFGEIQSLLNEDDDNVLVPSEGAAAFESGLDKQVWFMPLEALVTTLRELYAARNECKQAIYEIMGISDIIRGASNPHETASAQMIKDRWGSLRIKKAQKKVQLFCLDLFRIAVELAIEYFTPATWQQITRLPYLFMVQKQQLQQQFAAQPEAQRSVPPPDQLRLLQAPSWEDILQVLRGTFERSYRIDIETNSTVDLEATEDKEAISEFMNAFGQMTAGLAPMVESGVLPFEASKEILAETFRRFRFGRKVSDALEQMQPPQPSLDPKEVEQQVKQQAQLEKAALKAEYEGEISQLQARVAKLEVELAEKEAQVGFVERAAKLEERRHEVDGKIRQNELKQNYDGRLDQHKREMDNRLRSIEARERERAAKRVEQLLGQSQGIDPALAVELQNILALLRE